MTHIIAANDSAQHKLFRSNSKLSPDEINQLLGVRMEVSLERPVSEQEAERASVVRMFRFALVTLVLVTATIVGSMYQMKIGPFYESQYALTSSN